MKSLTSRTAATTAAIALLATPAIAQEPQEPRGWDVSPAKICKNESRKKTNHGKGKSPYAACVIGAARQEREARQHPDPNDQRAPGQICRDQSRKKDENDTKSPFAACVKGVTVARKQQREATQS